MAVRVGIRKKPVEEESPDLAPDERQALMALGGSPHETMGQRRSRFVHVRRFVGLDIHKEYLVVIGVDHDLHKVLGPVRLTWERWKTWAPQMLTPADAVAVEMTTNTWEVHDFLIDQVHSVTVAHPPHLKLITSVPVMNDKKSAHALAIILACGMMQPVWVPTPQVREWRSLVAARRDRVETKTAAKNRLHSILHRHHLEAPDTTLPFSLTHREWWLSLKVTPVEKLQVELDLAIVDQCEAQIKRIEAVMYREVVADERLPYLLQLPGIGLLSALTILAAIGPIERFAKPRLLVGYAGLGARVHDSGNTRTTGGITKAGRKDLRFALVNAAQTAARTHPHWESELKRLEPRIGRNKAIVAIARKLLVAIWYILTRRESDVHAIPAKVAGSFLQAAYSDLGAKNLPDGEVPLEFVRRNLDELELGKELQYVKHGPKDYILPQSSQPGAAPVVEPKKRNSLQNTRAAKEARAAEAARKRAEVEARRVEAEARMGRPRKARADKGTQRGPNKITKERQTKVASLK